jgi:UDP-GlcNAc:undecaprenyl-phosphate GlcNAc-1-phosphate transferase
MYLVMPFLIAMAVTMASLPIFGRVATRWSFVDRPDARKVHVTPIPRIGGIAMAVGILIAALIVIPLDAHQRYFLMAATVLVVFGGLDDRFDLDYRIKLLGQLLAAGIAVIGGDIQIHWITLDDRVALAPWISMPMTIFFLVSITNAINLADGLDGLAGGTTFLCLCALAMLAFSGGEFGWAVLALTFAGAVLGFLRFNTYPASVFMGDAGSQLLGFAVGVFSIGATQGSNTVVSAATPILLLALPILDTLSVMVQRIGEGRSPFSPDRNHIHHKLLQLGFDHHEAVTVIYLIQAALFLIAYELRFESDVTILGFVAAFFVIAVMVFQLASRRGWRFRAAQETPRETPLARLLERLRKPQNLPQWSYQAVGLGVGGYVLLIIMETAALDTDVRALVIGLLTISAVLLGLLRIKPLNLIEKAALYVTAAVLVYLDEVVLPHHGVFYLLSWVAVSIAAAGTVLSLRLKLDRRFVITPLDLIVLFVALVVPSLQGSLGLPAGSAAGIAKLVILFYAIEVLVSRVALRALWLRVAVTSVLAGLVLRPLLSI